MRRGFLYWTIRLVFVLVFIFFLYIIYRYLSFTKISSTNNTNSPSGTAEEVYEYTYPIKTLNSKYPSVYALGQVTDYEIVEDPKTGKIEIYVVLTTDEGYIPAKIDRISTLYSGPTKYYIVSDLTDNEKGIITGILDDTKPTYGKVDYSYINLISMRNNDDVGNCRKGVVTMDQNEELAENWCTFDKSQKSYSSNELLNLMEEHLTDDGNILNDSANFSAFLGSEGNLLVRLQINYISTL